MELFFPQLQCAKRLFFGDAWKRIQEIVNAVSGLKVVEEGFDGNPRAGETGRAAQSLGIPSHDQIPKGKAAGVANGMCGRRHGFLNLGFKLVPALEQRVS